MPGQNAFALILIDALVGAISSTISGGHGYFSILPRYTACKIIQKFSKLMLPITCEGSEVSKYLSYSKNLGNHDTHTYNPAVSRVIWIFSTANASGFRAVATK